MTGTPVGDIDTLTWSPADADIAEPLPMLFAHDGPELDAFAELTTLLGSCVASGRLPRMRVTLLTPGRPSIPGMPRARHARRHSPSWSPLQLRAHPSEHPPVLVGPSPRGARRPACRMDPSGHVRRAAHALRVVLHPGVGPAGARVRVLGRGRRVRRAGAHRAGPVTAEGRAGVGHQEENQFNNALMAARLGELGLPVHTATVENEGTTSPAGATCSTSCCPTC